MIVDLTSPSIREEATKKKKVEEIVINDFDEVIESSSAKLPPLPRIPTVVITCRVRTPGDTDPRDFYSLMLQLSGMLHHPPSHLIQADWAKVNKLIITLEHCSSAKHS